MRRHPNNSNRLRIEQLEERLVPATHTWDGGGVTNNWSEGANWTSNVAPDSADDRVVIVTNGTTVMNIPGLNIGRLEFNTGGVATVNLVNVLTIDCDADAASGDIVS